MGAGTKGRAGSALRRALLVAAVVLAGTAGERTYGTITDEQQPLGTAVAIVRFGEIGIGRGPLFSHPRPEGDAVSVYGIGQTFVELPAALVARPWERLFGGGSSQSLFVATELLIVLLAAGLAGLLARELGATQAGEALAVLGAALASPLGAYVKAGYSEPLQAACLAGALLFALRGVNRAGREAIGSAAAAGAFAGAAVLTKPTNLALAPLLLLPLVLDRDLRRSLRRAGAAAAGAAFPLAAWAVFDVVRFGGLLRAYAGLGFTHPVADGLLRLLFLPGKGLFVYFPLSLLAVAGLVTMARDRTLRSAALAIAASSAALLLICAAWWAWDGLVGWGPRFLVPLVPLLAAAAAAAAASAPRLGLALAVSGGLLNLPGLVQSESSAFTFVGAMEPRRLDAAEASRYPANFLERGPSGEALLSRGYVAASDADLSPFRVVPYVLKARLEGGTPDGVERRLREVPWSEARPDLVPDMTRLLRETGQRGALISPFRWPHLLEATLSGSDARKEGFNPAYDNALSDQLARAAATGRLERAAVLARELWELQPGGFTAAMVADTLRLTSRPGEAAAFLASLPEAAAGSPHVALARALLALPGSEADARAELRRAAALTHSRNLLALSEAALADWPGDLFGMEAAIFVGKRP